MEFALKLLARAIELDPTYVRAYAASADCYSFLFMHAGSKESDLDQADFMSRRALELDADSAEAHASRGVACSLRHNYGEAESEFEKAIHLDPTLFEAFYFYARACFEQGKREKAIQLYEKSIELNPQDYQAPLLVAQIYSDLGEEEKAAASRLRGVHAVEAQIKLHPDDTRALYMGANGWRAGRIRTGPRLGESGHRARRPRSHGPIHCSLRPVSGGTLRRRAQLARKIRAMRYDAPQLARARQQPRSPAPLPPIQAACKANAGLLVGSR